MTPATLAIMGSLVTLGPAENPDADAAVTFFNHDSNSSQDNGDYFLTWDGIEAAIAFTYDAEAGGADRITVTPPPGWTCQPADCTLTLMEGYSGTVELFAWKGM